MWSGHNCREQARAGLAKGTPPTAVTSMERRRKAVMVAVRCDLAWSSFRMSRQISCAPQYISDLASCVYPRLGLLYMTHVWNAVYVSVLALCRHLRFGSQ